MCHQHSLASAHAFHVSLAPSSLSEHAGIQEKGMKSGSLHSDNGNQI